MHRAYYSAGSRRRCACCHCDAPASSQCTASVCLIGGEHSYDAACRVNAITTTTTTRCSPRFTFHAAIRPAAVPLLQNSAPLALPSIASSAVIDTVQDVGESPVCRYICIVRSISSISPTHQHSLDSYFTSFIGLGAACQAMASAPCAGRASRSVHMWTLRFSEPSSHPLSHLRRATDLLSIRQTVGYFSGPWRGVAGKTHKYLQ